MAKQQPLKLCIFYNLRVGRDPHQVARELRALARPHQPPGGGRAVRALVIGGCEGIGYGPTAIPSIPHYKRYRDRSKASRANIFAYARDRQARSDGHWWDMKEDWGRTEHPGRHEPRSWLEFTAADRQWLIGHQPPKFTDNTIKAQQEGIDLLTRRMGPWNRPDWARRKAASKKRSMARTRWVLMDANRRKSEPGPGPAKLAHDIKGLVAGPGIDVGVGRRVEVVKIDYIKVVHGVDLKSDHESALFIWWRDAA